MKRLDSIFLVGLLLLIAGVVWALTMNGIGAKEWILLLSGTILGILAGVFQGWMLKLNKRGKIGSGMKIFGIVGAIILLVALKVTINISIPSYLATSESGIWVSVVYAIGGLLLGRSLYSRLR
ncbi:hypothetical protein M3661_29410 [Paenibacillus sp. MER 180]|uniref:Uncharacterized protein n=1 Tax=Paenibacillus alvei TaxID=44250 RepID=A0ABT4EAH7_PAEAL|nr:MULTISPECIES: hypothetical protein [Paenibacillus]MCM3294207.1 hypothetical protein [Paenibacillus sp. MER 180]MCY9529658.1 hypothetical protein [Paenibacillus alvei]